MRVIPSLFDFAGQSHRDDPDTSTEAAAAGPRLSKQRLACLVALWRAPIGLTPHEAVDQTPCSYPHVAATRFDDLRKLGLAAKTEEKRRTPSGFNAVVWTITDEGRQLAHQLTTGEGR